MQAVEPKLTYYYIRGLAQPIRNLLNYLEVKYIDQRLDKGSPESTQLDTLDATFNSGLPIFQDESARISDAIAISIHICNKYNAKSLLGDSLQSRVLHA